MDFSNQSVHILQIFLGFLLYTIHVQYFAATRVAGQKTKVKELQRCEV